MKILLKVLKWVGIVIAALLVISFVLPSKSHVERSMSMKADKAVLFDLVNDLHKWEMWSPWHDLDPNMKIKYNEIANGKGAKYEWTSENKNVGNGSMEIIDSKPNDEILIQMHFGEMGKPTAKFNFLKEGDATKVVWCFDGDCNEMPFYMIPMCKYFNLFMDKMIGADYEKGLKRLDSVSMAAPKIAEGKVESITELEVPTRNCITMKGETKIQDISKTLGELYSKIQAKIDENKLAMAGAPCAMYPGYKPGDTLVKIIACIPTNNLCKGKCDEGMKCMEIKTTKCVMSKYLGPYETNHIAYEAIQKYITEHKLTMSGDMPWEEYENDPMTEKDPSKYITNVYWPIK
jgi:effector-binding domain-containing protein